MLDSRWLERLHREWTPEQVAQFARYLEAVPSPLAPSSGPGVREFAARALDQAIDCGASREGLVDGLELQRIVAGFGVRVHQYALENQFVGVEPQRGYRITGLGRAFLRLRGRDAIRWLLTVEVSQSTGRWDPWRVSREVLKRALSGIENGFDEDRQDFVPSLPMCSRLLDLEVLAPMRPGPDEDVDGYIVEASMRELVQAVLEPGPWQAAVAALLEDERSAVVHGRGTAATDATRELTKLITHEVRNALVPVRHHMDALRATHTEEDIADRIEKARRGVVRVLEFVEELVATSDLVSEPATSCDVAELIREAIGWADGGERVEVMAGAVHRVHAPRSSLLRAVYNLVLNALQATSPAGPVQASYHANHDIVEIVVDDGGGGVPAELRTKVFDEGYTTRGGLGHGFGLASVRTFVEGTLRGKVWCEVSPLGGARFVIAIAEDTKP
jgi:nitrogen-specific signal transduction histidine kinase